MGVHDTITVADILAREPGLAWHEGIAIVQGLCERLIRSGAQEQQFPSPADIRLGPAGELSVLGLAHTPEGAVAGAARLLGSLIGGDAPVRLRLLLSQSAGGDLSERRLGLFSSELAYFERPDRAGIIRSVCERVGNMAAPDRFADAGGTPGGSRAFLSAIDTLLDGHVQPADSFENLAAAAARTPQAGSLAEAPASQTAAAVRRGLRLGRRAAIALGSAGAVAGILLIAALLARLLSQPAFPGPEAEQVATGMASMGHRVADRLVGTVAALGDRIVGPGRRNPEDGAAAPPVQAAGTAEAAPTRRPPARARAALTATAVASPANEGSLSTGVLVLPPASAPPGPPGEPDPAVVVAGRVPAPEGPALDNVFSAEHAAVVPPVPVRPQLPTAPPPGTPLEDIGIIDLVVAESGHVETVRLHTRPRDIRDVMLVSAAKSWRFEPATLDGQAVKYRLRVWINLP
jgi:hypothetical protein